MAGVLEEGVWYPIAYYGLANQMYVSNDEEFNRFCKASIDTLNSFTPTKFVRASEMPFVTKEFPREIVRRSRLRNNFLKRKQKKPVSFMKNKRINVCLSWKRLKKSITKIWKTVKPLLSDKTENKKENKSDLK